MFARRLFLLAFASLICVASAVVHVRADSVADAKALIASGDVDGGSKMLNAIAASGDAATQYAVGTELLNLGSDDDALRWITSSAERGHANAQSDMGLLYASGTFVKQDLPRAFMWYFLALKGDLDLSLREGAQKNAKSVYAAMTSQERKEAERLILNWKPRV
jgi:TPR repeat protein